MRRAALRILSSLILAIVPFVTPWAAAQHDTADARSTRIDARPELEWKVGLATVNITPDQFMWMAGYGNRSRPADGTLTDLWAKALVLEDRAGHRAVVITLDLVGIDRQLSRSIGASLGRHYSLSRRQIAICASHTHTGPVVGRNLAPLHYLQLDEDQRNRVDRYAQSLHDKVVDVVGKAMAHPVPCRLSWGTGTATFAVNRRNNPEDEVPVRRSEGTLRGPDDHDVPVLAVRDRMGRLLAVLFGYACHATVLDSYQWSGDYPGFAQAELQRQYPGCVAMFWAGCGADQNPLPRRKIDLAREYGKQLAAATIRVLATDMRPLPGELHTSYGEIELPLDRLPTRGQIEADAKSEDRFVSARARMLLNDLDQGQALKSTYPYPISVWTLGHEVQFIALGGEVVVDYALRLKSELGGTKTWVAGYAHDVMAYIPSRRVLREGGYEGRDAMVYYGLPTAWAPDVEKRIVDAVHHQINQLIASP